MCKYFFKERFLGNGRFVFRQENPDEEKVYGQIEDPGKKDEKKEIQEKTFEELLNLIAENPLMIFQAPEKYQKHPKYDELLEKAVRTMAEKAPWCALGSFDLYKDKSFADEVLEKAARVAAEKEPWIAFAYFNKYRSKPFADEVLERAARTAAEKDPMSALEYFDLYKDKPFADEVLKRAARAAAEKKPSVALAYFDAYKDKPFADEVLERAARAAAEKKPSVALAYFDAYKDKPYAKEVILAAAEKDPIFFIDYFERIKFILGDEAAKILQTQRARAEIVKTGPHLPGKTVKKEDFPINRETFALQLLGINSEIFRMRGESLVENEESFTKIFCDPAFQDFLKSKADKITYMNAFSLVLVVERRLERSKKPLNSENIREAAETVYKYWEKVRGRELFGPHMRLILLCHEESGYDPNVILEKIWKRSGGKAEDTVVAKGVEMKDGKNTQKEKILEAIGLSKGPTTIMFSGHGSPENWAFAENQADNLNRSLISQPESINYMELGDALIKSGNITDINLLGMTCFAYDYLINLFSYLESKGVKEKPYVAVSEANKAKGGWGGGTIIYSRILEAFYKVSKDKKPITVDHFFKAEGLVWEWEDPSLFIGSDPFEAVTPGEAPSGPLLPQEDGVPVIPSKTDTKQRESKPNPITDSPEFKEYPAPVYYHEIAARKMPQVEQIV